MKYSISFLLILALLTALGAIWWQANHNNAEIGKVILHAVDIDSGKPIENVSFAIENSLAEMWAESVGKSDKSGTLELKSKVKKGYFYSIYPLPPGYKVVGLDAIPSGIKLGETVEHRFHLRKLDTPVSVPALLPASDISQYDLLPQKNGGRTTMTMPGFEKQSVEFHTSVEQAKFIYRNGKRLRAAIADELTCFKKAEGKQAGDVSQIRNVKIIGEQGGWTVWCRTKGCLKLKQDGFQIHFDAGFNVWNLHAPEYLHPDF